MKFLSKKVEITTTWNTHSDKPHAVASIEYLGKNNQGWNILQLNPKFNDIDNMTVAVISVCADINNPDEEKGKPRKGFKYKMISSTKSVEIELEDIADFLHRLQFCKCITIQDERFILAAINKLPRKLNSTESLSQPLLSPTDRDHNSSEKNNCAY